MFNKSYGIIIFTSFWGMYVLSWYIVEELLGKIVTNLLNLFLDSTELIHGSRNFAVCHERSIKTGFSIICHLLITKLYFVNASQFALCLHNSSIRIFREKFPPALMKVLALEI